jgi:hypothetical protein
VDEGTQERCVVCMLTHVFINADNNKTATGLLVSKAPPYPLNRLAGGGGWAAQTVWMFGRREKSLARVGLDASFIGSVDM